MIGILDIQNYMKHSISVNHQSTLINSLKLVRTRFEAD
jgi:hypothetical protein